MRLFLILLLPFSLFGQEVYPSKGSCFCVPTVEIKYGGTGQKMDKIELIQMWHGFANAGAPTVFSYDSTFVRDIDNPAWASTDYYNQTINDTITMRIRRNAVGLKPALGVEDDIAFVFNTRTKDRPPFTGGEACDANVGTNVSMNHSFRIMLAIETINGNYRQGVCPNSNRTSSFGVKFNYTVGATTTEVSIEANPLIIPSGGWSAFITCPTDCATRWGSDADAGNFAGYFTERSLSKLWRNERNTFKMNNAGFWPGQIPHVGYLEKAASRCQTFSSFTCSNLSQGSNDSIADRIINAKIRGTCLPECGSCEAFGRGYFDFRPHIPCPSPSDGQLHYRIPQGLTMAGTWCVTDGTFSTPGSCSGFTLTGSLPATTIEINPTVTNADNGKRYIVKLLTTNPVCEIMDTIWIYSATSSDCPNAPVSGLGFISNKPGVAPCPGDGYSDAAYLLNRFAVSSGADSIRVYFTGGSAQYKKYVEYQEFNGIHLGVIAPTNLLFFAAKKGNLESTYELSWPEPVCPCKRNRYIVFNYNGLSGGRKVLLQNLGWTVLP